MNGRFNIEFYTAFKVNVEYHTAFKVYVENYNAFKKTSCYFKNV